MPKCPTCWTVNEPNIDHCLECHTELVRTYVVDPVTAVSTVAAAAPPTASGGKRSDRREERRRERERRRGRRNPR